MININQNALISNKKCFPPMVFDDDSRTRRARYDRYRLLYTARRIFASEGKKNGLKYNLNFHRTAKCSFITHNEDSDSRVEIHKSIKYDKAFYTGLITCGDIWNCPVCCAKVQERRRLEVAQGMDWAYKNRFKCIMVTTTFPHYIFQSLKELFECQKVALKYFRSGDGTVFLKEQLGFKGLIRSLELTYGDNGWHPHTHEIWIVDINLDIDDIHAEVLALWENACKLSGLLIKNIDDFRKHAIDIVDNCRTSEYLAKMDSSEHWGSDRELVSGRNKKIGETVHPFFFLDQIYKGVTDYIPLWLEYSKEIKGKSQLFWSHGLKKRVGLAEKSDKEIAEEKEDLSICLSWLKYSDWEIIRKWNAQSEILDIAETEGIEGLKYWLYRHY